MLALLLLGERGKRDSVVVYVDYFSAHFAILADCSLLVTRKCYKSQEMNLPFYTKKEVIDHEKTGRVVKKLRKARGISIRKLAQTACLLPMTLHRLERGEASWDESRTTAVVNALRKFPQK